MNIIDKNKIDPSLNSNEAIVWMECNINMTLSPKANTKKIIIR